MTYEDYLVEFPPVGIDGSTARFFPSGNIPDGKCIYNDRVNTSVPGWQSGHSTTIYDRGDTANWYRLDTWPGGYEWKKVYRYYVWRSVDGGCYSYGTDDVSWWIPAAQA